MSKVTHNIKIGLGPRVRVMTKEEFEAGYAQRSGLTIEALRSYGLVVEPCDCGYEGCDGWQMSRRVPPSHIREPRVRFIL